RRLFAVKRAEAFVVRAGFLQCDARTDDLDDVGTRNQLDDEGLRDPPGHAGLSAAAPARCAGRLLFGERRTDARADLAHVDAARRARLDLGHDLADVLQARGAGRVDGLGDERLELLVVELTRQVGLEYRDLGFFFRDEIAAPAVAVFVDGLARLLDHALDDGRDAGVVQRTARVDLALLYTCQSHAHDAEPALVAGFHRRLHVLSETFLERHDREIDRLRCAAASRVGGASSSSWRVTLASGAASRRQPSCACALA